MNAVETNLHKLKLLAVFQDAMAVIPVVVLYLESNGVSLAQAFQLQAIFSAALLLMEVPSGYLSDRLGRKPTLVVGSSVGLAGICVYAVGFQFWHFVVAEVLLAVLFAFHSGTREALTKETLVVLKRPLDYRRVARTQHSLGMASQAAAGIVGGLVATFSLRAPFVMEIAAFLAALVVTLRLVEPRQHIVSETKEMKSMWLVLHSVLVKNRALQGIILAASTISVLTLTLFWFTQPYQQLVEFPLALYGLSHAVMMLGAVGANLLAGRLEQRVGDRALLPLIAGVVIISFLAVGVSSSWVGIAWIFLGRSMWGALQPVVSDIINDLAPSSARATTLSIQSFVGRLLFMGVILIAGWLVEATSLQVSILAIGIAGGAGVTLSLAYLYRHWPQRIA